MLLPFDGATGQHCTCYIRPAVVEYIAWTMWGLDAIFVSVFY